MTEDITVVCECDAKDEARSMGYRRYADMHAADIVASWPLEYASHGSWDSHILPTLRCLAGYEDRVLRCNRVQRRRHDNGLE